MMFCRGSAKSGFTLKHFVNSRGFTLIEMMVVMTLMGGLVGVGLVNYNTRTRQRSVLEQAEKIRTTIQQARNNAVVGRKFGCASNEILQYWRVVVTMGTPGQVRSDGVCGASLKVFNRNDMTLDTGIELVRFIPPGTFDYDTTSVVIDYLPLGRGVTITANTSAGPVVLNDIWIRSRIPGVGTFDTYVHNSGEIR